MMTPKVLLARALAKVDALFGRGLVLSMGSILIVGLLASLAALLFMNSATPDIITITSGPKGSIFQKTAEKYRKLLAEEGVTVKIVPSEGSMDNLEKLSDPRIHVDVGFVLGGEAREKDIDNLVSLGSISYQPLMIFYRGKSRSLLSEFRGSRLDIGEEGSGTRSLAQVLLKANGFEQNDGTIYADIPAGDSVRALLENRIDAIFLMGDSTSTVVMRKLLHTPGIHLFNFVQADGYTRRIKYLNKLELPRGSLDLGRDIPDEDLYLIGPTVELVARKNLHPALSDLLLEAAREVNGKAGLFKKPGEFPSPLEHEFRISQDALRYYASGKSFLYRTFPFWMASYIARALAVILPVALLLIPALKITPTVYRWRIESRIYRWYRALLEVEREAADPLKREEALRNLDRIEHAVSNITVPASSGNLFYELRGHIGFVRERLGLIRQPDPPE
ncbi:MAG: TAXI family TRAP transporter solute-binding subunit [Burkholderiales bacterium]